MSKSRPIRRALRWFARRRAAKRKAAQAAEKARKRAQAQLVRDSRITAGEAREAGFEWAGVPLPDSTKVEPVFGPDGWTYQTVAPTRRKNPPAGAKPKARVCGAPTKAGAPCKRVGKCPDHPTKRGA